MSATFDPEKFEEKYVHYLDELHEAYRRAYQELHGQYDSTLLRAVDHRVLSESEPFYEGDGEFRVELPDDARARLGDVPADDGTVDAVLAAFVDGIEAQLRRVFGFEDDG